MLQKANDRLMRHSYKEASQFSSASISNKFLYTIKIIAWCLQENLNNFLSDETASCSNSLRVKGEPQFTIGI